VFRKGIGTFIALQGNKGKTMLIIVSTSYVPSNKHQDEATKDRTIVMLDNIMIDAE